MGSHFMFSQIKKADNIFLDHSNHTVRLIHERRAYKEKGEAMQGVYPPLAFIFFMVKENLYC